MKSTELTAVLLASTFMISGTYAWQAFSQSATNETMNILEEDGGRLHDDFDGENKDVYVENYSDIGGENVYARVQIREFMEYGSGAGSLTGGGSGLTLVRGDKQVTPTPSITDQNTWDVYLYGSTAISGTETIRTYRDLNFGGSTVYMPTFNKDNTDLSADINGTYIGLDNNRDDGSDAYSDYVNYILTDTKTDNVTTSSDPAGVSTTHDAKETATATIMTMSDWVDADGPLGDYWVFDVDGWAYYANPITPQEATGLLLDNIAVIDSPETSWYYGVDVIAQIATGGDWGDDSEGTGMHGDITSNGLGLLNKVAGIIDINIDIDMVGGNDTVEIDGIEWYVLDKYQVMEYTIDGDEVKLHDAYLIWAADLVALDGLTTSYKFHGSDVSTWSTSLMNTTTLPDWLSGTNTLKNIVIRTAQMTDGYYTNTTATSSGAVPAAYSYSETFLLSQPEYLSYIGLSGDTRGEGGNHFWLRSPSTAIGVRYVNSAGTGFISRDATLAYGVRPALWVVL